MMPSLRKLSEAEIVALEQPTLGARAQVAREYDAYVAGFAIGDYGRAELYAGEGRDTVRRQLQAAAKRRGLALRFRPGPGPLTFRVATAPVVASPTPPLEPAGAATLAGQARSCAAPTAPTAPPAPDGRRAVSRGIAPLDADQCAARAT
jgi:hypothetical protein